MKISRFFSAAILAIVAVLSTAPATAHADTYQVFDLGNFENERGLFGITDSGAIVFFDNFEAGCFDPFHSGGCFETWVDGTRVGFSPTDPRTDPGLTYDNGMQCTPTIIPPVTGLTQGVCNNGHEVYAYKPNTIPPIGLTFYDGPDLATDRIGEGRVFQADLNASGDFVFVDGKTVSDASGEWYEYIDLTTRATPEPTSIFLLGTGVFAALGPMRRQKRA
jgi:hypothetical protein